MTLPRHNLTGMKIRSLRRAAGLTQKELAQRSRISAPYLNLIERNKRAIAGVLLDRIAEGLGVDRGSLDGEAERRQAEHLNEIAADPAVAGELAPPVAAEELVSRHPDWAALIRLLHQAYRDRNEAVIALADRLNRDPFLGESVHRMLSNVTSIRSAAEILENAEALTQADRARFLAILTSDSRHLSGTAQALLAFFDSAQTRIRSATPSEHVDAFILEAGNHFPVLESIAADFLATVPQGSTPAAVAERMLAEELPHATRMRTELPEESWRFAIVRHAMKKLAGDAIAAIVGAHSVLISEKSRAIAASALESYAAAAILMPYERFLETAETERYDIDVLARHFRVSYEQAAHRLATLQRPGSQGVRFAFMRSDASGFVTKRLPLPRLPLPRYGSACPLWVIHGAFQAPGATARAFGRLPGGEEFLFFARAVDKASPAIDRPRRLVSVMLVCSVEDSGRIRYGDGLDRRTATVPLGTVCRLCPRAACGHRQEEQLIG